MIKGFDLFLFLNSIGIGLAFIYLIALIGKPSGNRLSNILTAINYFSQIFLMTAFVMYYLNEKEFLPFLLLITLPLGLLNGPLFWLGMKSFMLDKTTMERSDWLHFGQFIVSGIIAKVIAIFVPDFFQYIDLSRTDSMISTTRIWFALYICVNWSYYFYRFFNDLKQFSSFVRLKPSAAKKAKLNFAKLIAFNVTVLMLIYAYGFIFDFSMTILYIISSAISVIFIVDGIYILQHPEIYDDEKEEQKKYQNSTIPADKVEFYIQKLTSAMEVEKVYRNSELSLSGLAEKLNLSTHQLSELLNDKVNQNFNDYINGYRVEEAKKLLLDKNYEQYKVFAIAMEVGFNTKATFNAAFKKFTGKTPTEFREDS